MSLMLDRILQNLVRTKKAIYTYKRLMKRIITNSALHNTQIWSINHKILRTIRCHHRNFVKLSKKSKRVQARINKQVSKQAANGYIPLSFPRVEEILRKGLIPLQAG